MKEGIGSIFLYNIVIIFIVVVFAILTATLTYYKAFKVNTKIINSIEKFEGYNNLAIADIDNKLLTTGYLPKENHKCPKKNGQEPLSYNGNYRYCVYRFNESSRYDSYGVTTYITLDIPLIKTYWRIPIYARSNRIYRFNG